jgi:hypothetical protein
MTNARPRGRDDAHALRWQGRHAAIAALVVAGWLLFLIWMVVRG